MGSEMCIRDSLKNAVLMQKGSIRGALRNLISELERYIKKKIQVVKYVPTPERFLRSFLSLGPKDVVRVINKKDGESYAIIEVNPTKKGLVIGKGGRKIKQARFLANRYFGLRTVLVR